MDINQLFKRMMEVDGSDLFLKAGRTPFVRVGGRLEPQGTEILTAADLGAFVDKLIGPGRRQIFDRQRELNFAFELDGIGRFRANVMWQKGEVALVVRQVQHRVLDFDQLGLPGNAMRQFLETPHGLLLIAGPTGSGKSTTAAAILEYLNQNRTYHIVTLEEPIEYLFEEDKGLLISGKSGWTPTLLAKGWTA